MQRRTFRLYSSAFATCLGVLVGCGGPERFPVSGAVIFQGASVPQAKVAFYRPSGEIAVQAATDAEGKFVVPDGGLTQGDYDIAVYRDEERVVEPPDAEERPDAADRPKVVATPDLPSKYESPFTSGLKVEVGTMPTTELSLSLE